MKNVNNASATATATPATAPSLAGFVFPYAIKSHHFASVVESPREGSTLPSVYVYKVFLQEFDMELIRYGLDNLDMFAEHIGSFARIYLENYLTMNNHITYFGHCGKMVNEHSYEITDYGMICLIELLNCLDNSMITIDYSKMFGGKVPPREKIIEVFSQLTKDFDITKSLEFLKVTAYLQSQR